MAGYIGRPLPRLEDERLLTGRGRFADDERLERQMYCAFVRSPHAHARVVFPGKNSPFVLTGADYRADGLGPIEHVANPLDPFDVRQRSFDNVPEIGHWPLAIEVARHVGEPVALALAGTPQAARDAAEAVEVEYEPLSQEERELFRLEFGDAAAVRSAFAGAAHVVRHEFAQQRIANSPMEPRSAIGDYDPATGVHTLVCGSQGVLRLQSGLAAILGTEAERVRVITRDTGGGFGPRSHLHPEDVAVVWAAKRLGRPVKWTATRSEAFLGDFQGRDGTTRGALALDAEGRVLAYDVEHEGDVGAHAVSYVPIANFRNILTTVYAIPAARIELRAVLTNTPPAVPYRGAGRPEAHHVIERLLDIAARRLGIDRAEIRRRNLVRKLPYRTPMRIEFDSGDFAGYMERALALARYSDFQDRRKGLRGIGVANYVESPVGAPRERIELRIAAQMVEITSGTQSTGQGHETSFAQVVADKLGVPPERLRLRTGDTSFVTAGGGTHSDRSMRIAGTLLVRASDAIVEKGREAAAERLEARAEDIVFADGEYRIAGTDRRVRLLDLSLEAAEEFNGRIPAYPGGCAVCEVEVDAETGRARILRYVTVDDVGQAINPMIVEGQAHGGIAQGIGQALVERMAYDDAGQLLSGSYMDYGILRSNDLPSFVCELTEDPTSGNPLRVKGGGEGGVVPATAAVINALCDALGVEDLPLPATPQVLWQAIMRR